MKNFSTYKRIFTWLAVGIIGSLLSHYLIEILYYNYNFEHVHNLIIDGRPELFLLGSAILFVFYTLFSSVFGSSVIGGILLVLLSWTAGIATKYKSLYRAEPLYPNELYMVRELPFLLEMIGTKRTIAIILVILLTLTSIVLLYKYLVKPKKDKVINKKHYIIRIIGTVVSFGLLLYVSKFNYPNNKIKEVYSNHATWVTYNQNKNYSDNGFVAGFLSNLSAPPMETPEDYSEISMEILYEKYANIAQEINKNRENETLDTNIIFVMNESFSDPFNLNGIESNKDPIPNYREIANESVSGKVLAPSIGGGTATNEFQVLTGFSMEPFATQITSPFIQLTNQMRDFPSISNKFNNYNYKTTAIHPYTPTFYRRTDVYENLKFDEFLHQDNVVYREQISEKHRYISDFAAYQEVFDVLEKSKEKDFIHLVTIQNHMPYANKYDNVDFEVTGSGNKEEANAYFKDLENSDISLRLLINKIDDYPEPILLVFWGDHLPGFYEGEVLNNNNNQIMRETPFIVYSNEHNFEEEAGLISPIYLSNYINKKLDFKVNPYEALLLELEEKLPVIDDGLYSDINRQTFYNSREELNENTLDVLEDYSLLMYDISTGNQYAHDLGFFE